MIDQEISKAMDSAYKKAGNNAYFGNGFKAGVELMQQKNNEMLNLLNKAKDAFSQYEGAHGTEKCEVWHQIKELTEKSIK